MRASGIDNRGDGLLIPSENAEANEPQPLYATPKAHQIHFNAVSSCTQKQIPELDHKNGLI